MNIQFSRKYLRLLPQHKKNELAASLLTFPRARLLSLEKPVLPTIQKETRLVDLIGPRSWLILNVLEMEGTFLHKPPAEWEEDVEYEKFCHYARNLKVITESCQVFF